MILHDYKCLAGHGYFESKDAEPVCPECGGDVAKVFLQAPAVHTGNQAHNIDTLTRQLADEFHLTDMGNSKGSVMKTVRPTKPETTGNKAVDQLIQGKIDKMKAAFTLPSGRAPVNPNPVRPGLNEYGVHGRGVTTKQAIVHPDDRK